MTTVPPNTLFYYRDFSFRYPTAVRVSSFAGSLLCGLNRLHCCFYFFNPYGHGLKPLDVEVLRQLSDKVNVVPVIEKADCLGKQELVALKRKILDEIDANAIKIY